MILSLGLGSGGYDYSAVTPPTSPSNTTRRRRQIQEPRCPANGRNGEICLDPPTGFACFLTFVHMVGHFLLECKYKIMVGIFGCTIST